MTYMEHIEFPGFMSEEQAILLRRLCHEAGEPESFDPTLCQRRAAARIAGLIEDIRLRVLPAHTD
jgi:hypothetical protein